jgi:DNA-binding HxlR family transcriptional regulator
MSATRYTQFCALARAAEILGERWTLLIIRELLLGPKRFGDLSDHLAGVSPTLLTARLTSLVEAGVVKRTSLPAPFNAQVYELTPMGRDLKPVIREMIRWGGYLLFPMRADDEFEPDWVLLGLDAVTRQTASPPEKIALRVRHKHKLASFLVEGGKRGTTIVNSEAAAPATIEAGFDVVLRLIARDLSIDQAIAGRAAKVEGSKQVARNLPLLFDMPARHR